MFVGRVAAVSDRQQFSSSVSYNTYACPRKSKPRPVMDFDSQVIIVVV